MTYLRVSIPMLLAALMLTAQTTEAQKKKERPKLPESEQCDVAEKQEAAEQENICGIEKQRVKKAEQVQKELGKGSERGQEARQKRKKWWKFWGGEKEPEVPETPKPPEMPEME
ncbi:hypothetical protein ACFLQY_03175 [Verrucomicrobiota bacterium]